MNTMEDLRREVATRLRNTLHGREIDMIKGKRPRLPHMLGITPLDETHEKEDEEDTILDTDHQFWQEWHERIDTGYQVRQAIETAMQSLNEDGIFRVTYPRGREAEIAYVEVDELPREQMLLQTSCRECEKTISTTPSLSEDNGYYYMKFTLDCPRCDFSGVYEEKLERR